MMKKLFAVLVLFFPVVCFAENLAWQIVPKESEIIFTATQNGAPVAGKFTQFKGDIQFDPAALKTSHVRIVINMASVTTDYADVANTLKTADWFNSAVFPEAIFTASDFTKTGDKSYEAKGSLMIRDKTVPTVLEFKLDEFTSTKARVTGLATLKRLSFGVGQGEWQKTDNVKDDVQVQFTIGAVKG